MKKDDSYSKISIKAAQVLIDCTDISDINIDTDKEVVNMCKAWDDKWIEVERETTERVEKETAILSTIKVERRHNTPEDEILMIIMQEFNLDESDAKQYMSKNTA